jgi:hypothetical protein
MSTENLQLNLFSAVASSSKSVVVPWHCRCGGTTASLGSSQGVHAGRLLCDECGRFIKWTSAVFTAEIRSGFVTGRSSFQPGARP